MATRVESTSSPQEISPAAKNEATVNGKTFLLICAATRAQGAPTQGSGDANPLTGEVLQHGTIQNIEKVFQENKLQNIKIFYGPEAHYKATAEAVEQGLKSRKIDVIKSEEPILRKANKEKTSPAYEDHPARQKRAVQGGNEVLAKVDPNTLTIIVTDADLNMRHLKEIATKDKALEAFKRSREVQGKSLCPGRDEIFVLVRDANNVDHFVKKLDQSSSPKL